MLLSLEISGRGVSIECFLRLSFQSIGLKNHVYSVLEMSQTQISDEELLKYWRNENFSGSYRGARIFQVLLKTDENIDVPLSRIYKVLSKDQGCLHKTSVRIL